MRPYRTNKNIVPLPNFILSEIEGYSAGLFSPETCARGFPLPRRSETKTGHSSPFVIPAKAPNPRHSERSREIYLNIIPKGFQPNYQ